MQNTFDQFLAAYKQAPLSLKQLIDSEEIGIFADTLPVTDPSKTYKQKLLVLISNRVLNIITEEKLLMELLQFGIDVPTAQIIFSKIKNFVDEILKRTTLPISPAELMSNEIAETEALLKNLPPVRTMAGDGQQHIPTYTSTQSALLQEGRLPERQIPPSQIPTNARWETDT